ncbi:MAG: FtsX-like permease family protein [Lachnospiraceae bacterium]|nr:FtsX-like permease family protein [Lachnospiraceae bacterium]
MRHYLDLVSLSAKEHRRQNRMTRLCIVLAVFLVTVIFGMADMEMRSQMLQAVKSDGSWHAGFVINEEQGAILAARPEVEHISPYGALNYYRKDGYQIEGEEALICGFDPELLEMFPAVELLEGELPEREQEMVVNETIRNRLGVQVGDYLVLTIPGGEKLSHKVTGIARDTALTAEKDAFGVFLSMGGFENLHGKGTEEDREEIYYVTFRSFTNIQRAIRDIQVQLGLGDDQVRQNAKVLLLLFQSRDSYLMQFYLVAVVLAVLVLAAGVLMITASMNSSIARRTEFFGLLGCLGATRGQVLRFVQREALGWCKRAIPVGIFGGIAVIWGLCAMLRALSPGLFEGLPVFGISFPAIIAGLIVGVMTVLLAAKAPAKRAAQVSPLTAVSGNGGSVQPARRAADTRIFPVDVALGIHHAFGSKRNFFLVSGSFAFSIVLFLAFSTGIDFMHHALTPLQPWAPDLCVYSEENQNLIPRELGEEVKACPGVKKVFGRGYGEITVDTEEGIKKLSLISYDKQQFDWAQDSLVKGELEKVIAGEGILLVFGEEGALAQRERVLVNQEGQLQELLVCGILEMIPYPRGAGSASDVAICSEDLFSRLTKETGYAVLDIQLDRDAGDQEVRELRRIIEESCQEGISFSDKRMGNRETKGAGYSMALFLYGFLVVIGLIAFFNIVNCVAMSVSARMKEYGAMRAIGMSTDQLIRMVLGETLTYMVFGVVFGCLGGIPLNRQLFASLVTSRWGEAWQLPAGELAIIVFIVALAVCLAVLGPARQFQRMTVVDTLGAE